MTDEVRTATWAFASDFIKTVGFPIAIAIALLLIGREQMKASMEREGQFTTFVTTQLSESLLTTRELVQNNGSLLVSLRDAVTQKTKAIDANTEQLSELVRELRQNHPLEQDHK